jgi:trans-aconitate methyltransferase
VSIVAGQFGRPHGVMGRLVGRIMVRGNGDFNRWVVAELHAQYQGDARRIVELGPGPGVGLEAAISAFPAAEFWGIDPSPEMLSQSRKRNLKPVVTGRLTLARGDVASLARWHRSTL